MVGHDHRVSEDREPKSYSAPSPPLGRRGSQSRTTRSRSCSTSWLAIDKLAETRTPGKHRPSRPLLSIFDPFALWSVREHHCGRPKLTDDRRACDLVLRYFHDPVEEIELDVGKEPTLQCVVPRRKT